MDHKDFRAWTNDNLFDAIKGATGVVVELDVRVMAALRHIVSTILVRHNGVPTSSTDLRQRAPNIEGDAAGEKGWGWLWTGDLHHERGDWSTVERPWCINTKELYTQLLAARYVFPLIRGQRIALLCDNATSVAGINKLSSTSGDSLPWIIELFELGVEFDVEFTAYHIPGAINLRTDALSRRYWGVWAALMRELRSMNIKQWRGLQFWLPPKWEARQADPQWLHRLGIVQAVGALAGFGGGAGCLPDLPDVPATQG